MNKAITFRLLTIISILLIVFIYFSPIWWVKLEAPAYPNGVPINFHVNGIFNGAPVTEGGLCDELTYWVHEMDILNHFVGMYPTGTPGAIERALSPFLFAFLILLLLVFMISGRRFQATVFAVGLGMIMVWAYFALFTPGGISLMSEGYQQFVQCDMDMEPDEIQDWTGLYTMQESYYASLSKTTQSRDVNEKMASVLMTAAYVVIGVLIGGAFIFLVGLLWKNNLFYWLLVIIPILLPVFFVLEYAGWLWWVGHNLGEWAAFPIRPFMPTVLGEARIIGGPQFVTYSYPHYGYGLMILSSVLLIFATSLRRKQLWEIDKGADTLKPSEKNLAKNPNGKNPDFAD